MRKVELRGLKDLGRIEEDSESIIQQTMYEDIWKRDEYFQFMYERLILLKELLAETGSIYVHLDYRAAHYIKILLDEIFGDENFVNEIVWTYNGKGLANVKNKFVPYYGNIFLYRKSNAASINNRKGVVSESVIKRFGKYFQKDSYYITFKTLRSSGETSELEKATKKFINKFGREPSDNDIAIDYGEGMFLKDVWDDIPIVRENYKYTEYRGYTTQKPGDLLKRIINSSSERDGLVLDCFIGSGTTCIEAQKYGRKWIGVDINKGAIQVTSKSIQQIINQEKNEKYSTFAIYKVNNYDLKILEIEAKELAIQQYGITKIKTDSFFDGLRDSGELVKIIDFNHLLTLLDLQLIVDELNKRPDEDRDIVVISFGRETKVDAWVEEWNKRQPYKDTRTKKRMRQFIVFDLKDKNFVSYEPSQAEIEIKRVGKDKAKVKITSFISPIIIKRLELEPGLLQKKIPDFRSMIDVVLVDTNYDGEVFKISFSDVPEKQSDLIKGEYELEITEKPTKVAVKIIDMLGEEVLITKEV